MNKIIFATVAFGKAEEMDKCFYSLKHYIDVPVNKLVFINSAPDISGAENVEVFNKYRQEGDRGFLCDDNYWTTPYRYMVCNLIPPETKYTIYSECDIWFERSTSFFSRALVHLQSNTNIGFVSLLTRYYSSTLAQPLAQFDGYKTLRPKWGAQFLWHWVVMDNDVLRRYYRSKHRLELCDGNVLKFCRKQGKEGLIEDGREVCVHFDCMATQAKYPHYGEYYGNAAKVLPEFKSKFRYFDSTKFVEI